jgi:hypothetical protein
MLDSVSSLIATSMHMLLSRIFLLPLWNQSSEAMAVNPAASKRAGSECGRVRRVGGGVRDCVESSALRGQGQRNSNN